MQNAVQSVLRGRHEIVGGRLGRFEIARQLLILKVLREAHTRLSRWDDHS
jgi:hypothetical protein